MYINISEAITINNYETAKSLADNFISFTQKYIQLIFEYNKEINIINELLLNIETTTNAQERCNQLSDLISTTKILTQKILSNALQYFTKLNDIYNVLFTNIYISYPSSTSEFAFDYTKNRIEGVNELTNKIKKAIIENPDYTSFPIISFKENITLLSLFVSTFKDIAIKYNFWDLIDNNIRPYYENIVSIIQSSNIIIIDVFEKLYQLSSTINNLFIKYNCELLILPFDYKTCIDLSNNNNLLVEQIYSIRVNIDQINNLIINTIDPITKEKLSIELEQFTKDFNDKVNQLQSNIQITYDYCDYIETNGGYFELNDLAKYAVFYRYDKQITGLNKMIATLFNDDREEIGYIDTDKTGKDFYEGTWYKTDNDILKSGKISINFDSPNTLIGSYTTTDEAISNRFEGTRKWDELFLENTIIY